MKKILITGASGFIGSFLVEEALKRDYDVYAGIRKTSSREYLADKRIKLLELDFSNSSKLEKIITDFKNKEGAFDFVIHNAGITKARKPEEFLTVNYQYTKNFVDVLGERNAVAQKFVYISSLASYGPGKGRSPIKHEDIPNPISMYGQSKLESEKYLNSLKGFPFVAIRPSAVYGPRDKEFFALYKTLNRGLEPYIGSMDQRLSCVYVHDLTRAIFAAMESSHTDRAYFISDGNEYSIKEFNEAIKKNLQKKTVRIVFPNAVANPVAFLSEKLSAMTGKASTFNRERLKEYKAANWLCDVSPLQEELKFQAEHNLETGMDKTIKWYKENRWL
jgi:nucleoside-diphosphate-sugar epimerase